MESDTVKASKRRPIPLRLNLEERAMVEHRAAQWGVALAAAIRRMIREHSGPQQ